MIPETRFEQCHSVTAGKLAHALSLIEQGSLDEARQVIADVQKTNEEQSRVIDPRVYAAVRHICESRRIDSRRFFAMQQVLGLREVVRSLMLAPAGMDMIAMHLPIENDFFAAMLSHIPKSPNLAPLECDAARNWRGIYQNGNSRLWKLFCEEQKQAADQEAQA